MSRLFPMLLSSLLKVLLLFMCLFSFSVSQIRIDLQKGLQQHDETTTQALIKFEQRINNVRVDLNRLEEQVNQRISQVSSSRWMKIQSIDIFAVNRNYGGLCVSFPFPFPV